MNTRATRGKAGEQAVVAWLKNCNFAILAQNYRTRLGEVDIIAQRDDVLAFVEVKMRRDSYFPLSSIITYQKQQRIIKTAKSYMLQENVVDKVCRFDVAFVVGEEPHFSVDYIEDAFQV